jgi:uncharacterized membrane protein
MTSSVLSRHEEIASAVPHDLDALPRLRGFRLRGLEMTRLETFVDATFAFAITTLVIAGERAPDDIASVLTAFNNVPAFGASILLLSIFWRGHWLWSRRYGLEDGFSIAISWALIFTMLISVYPLKVVFNGMFYALSGRVVGQPLRIQSWIEARQLFAAFALGFTAIATEILLLNLRAWRLRDALRLNQRERILTLSQVIGWGVPVTVGLTSLLLAMTLPNKLIAWSGWIYFSILFLTPLRVLHTKRTLRRLEARVPT